MTWEKAYMKKLKEQKKLSKAFSAKINYIDDIAYPVRTTFAGQPSGSIWIAKPDFKAIAKRMNIESWIISITVSVILGIILGLLIS